MQMSLHPHRLFYGDRYCPPVISPPSAVRLRMKSGALHTPIRKHHYMTMQQTFADLGVGKPITDVLAAGGIVEPFPIQVATLPDTLAGRDALGRGKTGSGKTLAFCIPLVERLARSRRTAQPQGLILAPTRELASQISAVLEPLAAAHKLKVTTIFGGVPQSRQAAALRSGVDIIVAS